MVGRPVVFAFPFLGLAGIIGRVRRVVKIGGAALAGMAGRAAEFLGRMLAVGGDEQVVLWMGGKLCAARIFQIILGQECQHQLAGIGQLLGLWQALQRFLALL